MKTLKEIYDNELEQRPRSSDKDRYLKLYSTLFEPYRQEATSVFEIGINRGGSIRIWHEYFTKAIIYGLDLKDWCVNEVNDLRIKAMKLDQGEKDQLESFRQFGPFDIGIDDGSHIWSHQIMSFQVLWPCIKPNGLYIVEDLDTSYDSYLNSCRGVRHTKYDQGSIRAIDYFKSLIDEVNTNTRQDIDWMLFGYNIVVVKKV